MVLEEKIFLLVNNNIINNLIEYTTLNKDVDGLPQYVIDELKTLDINSKLNKGFEYEPSLHWITEFTFFYVISNCMVWK